MTGVPCPRCGKPASGGSYCNACGAYVEAPRAEARDLFATLPPTERGITSALAMRNRSSAVLAFAGALVLFLGAWLPWIELRLPDRTLTSTGADGDGVITLVLAVVAGVLATLVLTGVGGSMLKAAVVGAGVAALVVAAANIADVGNKADDVETSRLFGDVNVEVGTGLWLTAVGAIGVGVAGVMMKRQSPPSRAARPTSGNTR